MYDNIRSTLCDFYFTDLPTRAERVRQRVYREMDAYAAQHPDASAYELKAHQYACIAEAAEPVILPGIPFCFETGALVAFSDGRFNRGAEHANGWLFHKNLCLYEEADPHAFKVYRRQKDERFYAQGGVYSDFMHKGIPMTKLFRTGLSGILEEVKSAEKDCDTDEERQFLTCAAAGISALCRIEERFAESAKEAGEPELAELISRVPYHAPKTFREGLCTLAFMRKALGALEGVGFSSFGRVDVLLSPLYENDEKRGVDRETQKDLVTRFLLIWDCALDKRVKMEKAFEYELENSLTLGGCGENGEPVFNEVTKLFLEVQDEENILYPKMMLRCGKNAPEEYLRRIVKPLLAGKSFSLIENDDAIIPAMIFSGVEPKDAKDYAVGGCWDILTPDVSIHNSGEYFNLLRPLELSIHRQYDVMRECELYFEPLEECADFEQLYTRYLGYLRRVFVQKAALTAPGARLQSRVNPVCALSALTEVCIPKRREIAGGSKYNIETAYLCCFAEAIDSLLAIKHLCFDKALCSVEELFRQCRENWPDEVLRQRAIHAPSYGDGSEDSSRFTGRLVRDIYRITRDLPTAYGGEYRLGSNLYTEILRWGELAKALPSGRKDGEYLSQGITPSRIQEPVTLSDVFASLRYTDMELFSANASITLTLPAGKLDADKTVMLLRAALESGLQAIQPNCVRREDLLMAQKHPENYGHIIVRVCGFSAPFVSLAPHYQEEVISRMVMR